MSESTAPNLSQMIQSLSQQNNLPPLQDLMNMAQQFLPQMFQDLDLSSFESIVHNVTIRQRFCALFLDFFSSLHECFPDCQASAHWLEEMKTNIITHDDVEDVFAKHWYQSAFSHLELADSHDDAFFQKDIYVLNNLDLPGKIAQLPSAKEVIWEYLDSLVEFSRIYNLIPEELPKQLQSMAVNMFHRIQSGEMKLDINDLDETKLKQLGTEILNTLNPQDVNQLTHNMNGLAKRYHIEKIEDIPQALKKIPIISDFLKDSGIEDVQSLEDLQKVITRSAPGAQEMIDRIQQMVPPEQMAQFMASAAQNPAVQNMQNKWTESFHPDSQKKC